jgi:hypothetical protein
MGTQLFCKARGDPPGVERLLLGCSFPVLEIDHDPGTRFIDEHVEASIGLEAADSFSL